MNNTFTNALVPKGAALVFLAAIWVALWGDVSFANIAGGLLLGGGILALGLGNPTKNSFRVRPLLKLSWLVLVDLVNSTAAVSYEVARLSDRTEESIIAIDLPDGSQRHLFLLTILITVTPGTAVVDTDPTKGILYLHLLHHGKAEATKRHVARIAELSCRGLPSSSQEAVTQPTTGAPS